MSGPSLAVLMRRNPHMGFEQFAEVRAVRKSDLLGDERDGLIRRDQQQHGLMDSPGRHVFRDVDARSLFKQVGQIKRRQVQRPSHAVQGIRFRIMGFDPVQDMLHLMVFAARPVGRGMLVQLLPLLFKPAI